jgi:CRP-like cAMP-binding protein
MIDGKVSDASSRSTSMEAAEPHLLQTRPACAQDMRALCRTPPFNRLSGPQLLVLADAAQVCAASRDFRLIARGETAQMVYFLLDGLVKVSRDGGDGETAVLLIEGAGRPLMLAESLSGRPCAADLDALTPLLLIGFKPEALRQDMEREPNFARAVLAVASLDLHQLISQVEELKAMTGPGRIAALILQLTGAKTGPARVKLPYAKQLLASRLGMTPESFSRAIRRLREIGVKPRGDEFVVTELSHLAAFVEGGGRLDQARSGS